MKEKARLTVQPTQLSFKTNSPPIPLTKPALLPNFRLVNVVGRGAGTFPRTHTMIQQFQFTFGLERSQSHTQVSLPSTRYNFKIMVGTLTAPTNKKYKEINHKNHFSPMKRLLNEHSIHQRRATI